MKYRFLDDITSDVVFEAYGRTLKQLFENAARALSGMMCQTDKIRPLVKKEVEIHGDGLKDMMFDWLQKIIEVVDVDNLFLSEFDVKEIDENHLRASCSGEEISPEKGGVVVKAVTYHRFNIEKTHDGYKATVSLDI
jgi:SHS2 domain-containing protein